MHTLALVVILIPILATAFAVPVAPRVALETGSAVELAEQMQEEEEDEEKKQDEVVEEEDLQLLAK